MSRFPSDTYLTTSEAARLLDIHPSTVKRWCNDGELDYDTTGGGHRRIHLDAVLEAARRREISTFLTPFQPYERHVWRALRQALEEKGFTRARSLAFGWLSQGRVDRLRELVYRLGRHPDVDPVSFVDGFVRDFMDDVGSAWRDGRIRVGDEHLASQAVLEALLRIRETWLEPLRASPSLNGHRPVAVVGAMESEHHHLGAMCVRILLEREGWRVVYLGPNVPAEEFGVVQRAHGAGLVGISLAPPHTGADVHRTMRILRTLYRNEAPYALAFGGGGCRKVDLRDPAEGLPFRAVRCFTAAEDFMGWVEETPAGEAAS